MSHSIGTADGEGLCLGSIERLPAAVPYDRVIATCSVQTVPYASVAQTRSSTPASASACECPTADSSGGWPMPVICPRCGCKPDSWACMHATVVRQAGEGRLWDVVATAYSRWQLSGRPHRDRYGVTVTADHKWVWLDDPARPVTPQLAGVHHRQHHSCHRLGGPSTHDRSPAGGTAGVTGPRLVPSASRGTHHAQIHREPLADSPHQPPAASTAAASAGPGSASTT